VNIIFSIDNDNIMMNRNMGSKFYNNNIEENDGETDNYITCPLLQIKYSRPRKPITRYVCGIHVLDIL